MVKGIATGESPTLRSVNLSRIRPKGFVFAGKSKARKNKV